MSFLGFQKTYTAGTFDAAACTALFGSIKTYLVNAGFNVQINTATAIDFYPAGVATGTIDDDLPHFAIVDDTLGVLTAYSVYGADYADVGAKNYSESAINITWPDALKDLTVYFFCNAQTGFVHFHADQPGDILPKTMVGMCSFTKTKRYPADLSKGVACRYGIWSVWNNFGLSYMTDLDGVELTNTSTNTFSPLGDGRAESGWIPVGHPVAPMVVNSIPASGLDIAACVFGECEHVYIATKNWTQGDAPAPGLFVFTGDDVDPDYAVSRPVTIDVI